MSAAIQTFRQPDPPPPGAVHRRADRVIVAQDRPSLVDAPLNHAVTAFASARPRLVGIAHRVLGSRNDAEDLVQETWVRWQAYDRSSVRNSAAFLAVTTTRLAINATLSARARNETCSGPWLPEKVDHAADPGRGSEREEALEVAITLLMEKLSPTERAAYILREAFDYPYAQIAEIIGVEEANARQVVSRARKHVMSTRRNPVNSEEIQRLLATFLKAARVGDFTDLEDLFRRIRGGPRQLRSIA